MSEHKTVMRKIEIEIEIESTKEMQEDKDMNNY